MQGLQQILMSRPRCHKTHRITTRAGIINPVYPQLPGSFNSPVQTPLESQLLTPSSRRKQHPLFEQNLFRIHVQFLKLINLRPMVFAQAHGTAPVCQDGGDNIACVEVRTRGNIESRTDHVFYFLRVARLEYRQPVMLKQKARVCRNLRRIRPGIVAHHDDCAAIVAHPSQVTQSQPVRGHVQPNALEHRHPPKTQHYHPVYRGYTQSLIVRYLCPNPVFFQHSFEAGKHVKKFAYR